MNKVISGKTILLNTRTNCTFIASDLDEQVQTGTRENDRHIEWVGELSVGVTEKEYRNIAEHLWKMLDDIDTASDAFKPNDLDSYKSFYHFALQKSSDRFRLLTNARENGNKLIIHPRFPKS